MGVYFFKSQTFSILTCHLYKMILKARKKLLHKTIFAVHIRILQLWWLHFLIFPMAFKVQREHPHVTKHPQPKTAWSSHNSSGTDCSLPAALQRNTEGWRKDSFTDLKAVLLSSTYSIFKAKIPLTVVLVQYHYAMLPTPSCMVDLRCYFIP